MPDMLGAMPGVQPEAIVLASNTHAILTTAVNVKFSERRYDLGE
jgi:hypothetical protein